MAFLLRNWHLKLSAVLLATILYTGLVFSGSFTDGAVSVRVQPVNASRDTFTLTGDLGLVEVRYRTANDFTPSVTADAFTARVDLSEYDMDRAPEPQLLPIEVLSAIEGITILGWEPRQVRVELDRIEERTVPVEVEPGEIPEGLEIGDPVLSVEEVQVRGPASSVSQVDHAAALIDIDASGINFNESVDLVPVDIRGQPVARVDLDPESVSVQVDVQAVQTTGTVPVRPQIEEGTPAPGYALVGLNVEPSTVTLRGLPEVLKEISEVLTQPLSIDGLTADETFEAQLILPDDTELVDEDEPVVSVTARIEPSVSSRTFVVGVLCEGAGENACLPGLDQLAVTLSGPGGTLSDLTAAQLTPVIDAGGLAPGSYSLTPALGGLPSGVELESISPGSVPVTIVAPATPVPTPTPEP